MAKLFVFFFFTRPLSLSHLFFPTRRREKRFPETRCFDCRYNICIRIKIHIVLYCVDLDWCFFFCPHLVIVLKAVVVIGGRYVTQHMRRGFWVHTVGRPWEFLSFFLFFFCLDYILFVFYASLHAVATAYTPPFVSIRVRTQRWPAPYVYYVIGRYRWNTRTKNRISHHSTLFTRLNKKRLSSLPFACRSARSGSFSEE